MIEPHIDYYTPLLKISLVRHECESSFIQCAVVSAHMLSSQGVDVDRAIHEYRQGCGAICIRYERYIWALPDGSSTRI